LALAQRLDGFRDGSTSAAKLRKIKDSIKLHNIINICKKSEWNDMSVVSKKVILYLQTFTVNTAVDGDGAFLQRRSHTHEERSESHAIFFMHVRGQKIHRRKTDAWKLRWIFSTAD
jgi:hypothetical protein